MHSANRAQVLGNDIENRSISQTSTNMNNMIGMAFTSKMVSLNHSKSMPLGLKDGNQDLNNFMTKLTDRLHKVNPKLTQDRIPMRNDEDDTTENEIELSQIKNVQAALLERE